MSQAVVAQTLFAPRPSPETGLLQRAHQTGGGTLQPPATRTGQDSGSQQVVSKSSANSCRHWCGTSFDITGNSLRLRSSFIASWSSARPSRNRSQRSDPASEIGLNTIALDISPIVWISNSLSKGMDSVMLAWANIDAKAGLLRLACRCMAIAMQVSDG